MYQVKKDNAMFWVTGMLLSNNRASVSRCPRPMSQTWKVEVEGSGVPVLFGYIGDPVRTQM